MNNIERTCSFTSWINCRMNFREYEKVDFIYELYIYVIFNSNIKVRVGLHTVLVEILGRI